MVRVNLIFRALTRNAERQIGSQQQSLSAGGVVERKGADLVWIHIERHSLVPLSLLPLTHRAYMSRFGPRVMNFIYLRLTL
jgi:hypothetical protein